MRWTARLLVGGAVVTAGLLALAAYAVTQLPEDRREEVWLEVARAAIQALAIGVVGGFLAYLFRQHELERERRARMDEVRLRLLLDVVSAYNRAKAVRRVLRAVGLRNPANDVLTASQIEEYGAGMRVLNDAQLDLERITRELDAGAGRFANASDLSGSIRVAEGYFRDILDEWERRGPLIRQGDIDALRGADALRGFLATRDQAGGTFIDRAADQLDFIEDTIRAEIAGSARHRRLTKKGPALESKTPAARAGV